MKNKKLEINLVKKLTKLVSFRSVSQSKEQTKLRDAIQKSYGGKLVNDNLIITKGNPKIAIVAHLDINQNKGNCNMMNIDNILFSSNNVGCGFDDKAGICFALWYLENNTNIQLIFTLDEEIGCIGAKKVKLDGNIKFLVQLDRRGKSDVSKYTNGIDCINEELQTMLQPTLDKFNFKFKDCVYTDIGEISKNNLVQSVNISCGYYNEHTKDEYLNLDEFINSCLFAKELIKELNKIEIAPLVIKPKVYSYKNSYFEDDFYDDNYKPKKYSRLDIFDYLDSLTTSEINELREVLKWY